MRPSLRVSNINHLNNDRFCNSFRSIVHENRDLFILSAGLYLTGGVFSTLGFNLLNLHAEDFHPNKNQQIHCGSFHPNINQDCSYSLGVLATVFGGLCIFGSIVSLTITACKVFTRQEQVVHLTHILIRNDFEPEEHVV
jgi:hypothetical protein